MDREDKTTTVSGNDDSADDKSGGAQHCHNVYSGITNDDDDDDDVDGCWSGAAAGANILCCWLRAMYDERARVLRLYIFVQE